MLSACKFVAALIDLKRHKHDWHLMSVFAHNIATLNDSAGRRKVAEVLAQIGVPAVESLITALKENDSAGRQRVVEVLAQIGAPAVEPFITALKGNV